MRYPLLLILSLAVVPRIARGQTCMGQTSYTSGSVKVGAGAEFGNGGTTFTGSAGLGRPHGIFGAAAAGFVTGSDGTGALVSGLIGKELSDPIVGRLKLCPVAGLGLQFGPTGYYERNYLLGAMIGYPLTTSSGHLRIILTGGCQGAYQQNGFHDNTQLTGYRRADRSAGGNGLHEWYGLLDAGVGLIFSGRFSVVPQVRVPLGYSFRDPSFLIRGSVNFGKGN